MSDWREQALSAARDAWHGAIVDIPEAVVDAVAPIIRADEQKRIGDAIDRRYQDIKRQPKDRRLTAYWDGVLDGLDIGEQIARGEISDE